jgi:hypothetical protein
MYAATTKDKGIAADGCFSAAFSEKRSQPLFKMLFGTI